MDLISGFELPDIPVQKIYDPLLEERGVSLSVLRADLVHPIISGNKWFKLKHNLIQARQQGCSTLLSFGGAWSNHLHALAEAGRLFDFHTIGLIRGELSSPINACLADATQAGMQLESISRALYKEKQSADFLQQLKQRFGEFYLIPEGGANREGVRGCAEIVACYQEQDYDLVCMACGTGTMLTGLASSSSIPILGFQVLKGDNYLRKQVEDNLRQYGLSPQCDWSVNQDFHFGGYAKVTDELFNFINCFEEQHNIPLEPVYSGKMLFGIYQLIKKRDFFPQNKSILVVHGGGLQGRRGYM
jgi:1-aminocyclopropane-1-carboxylate deaminase